MAMRFALREDVLVLLVEPDPSMRRERDQVRFVDRVEGGMLLEEVGDAMADGSGFH